MSKKFKKPTVKAKKPTVMDNIRELIELTNSAIDDLKAFQKQFNAEFEAFMQKMEVYETE